MTRRLVALGLLRATVYLLLLPLSASRPRAQTRPIFPEPYALVPTARRLDGQAAWALADQQETDAEFSAFRNDLLDDIDGRGVRLAVSSGRNEIMCLLYDCEKRRDRVGH